MMAASCVGKPVENQQRLPSRGGGSGGARAAAGVAAEATDDDRWRQAALRHQGARKASSRAGPHSVKGEEWYPMVRSTCAHSPELRFPTRARTLHHCPSLMLVVVSSAGENFGRRRVDVVSWRHKHQQCVILRNESAWA